MANKLVPVVKKALAKKYGFKNVSVKNGQGTAYGWVEVRIDGFENSDRSQRLEISKQAEQISKDAVKQAGMEFYTYCSDDGYNSNQDCFLLSVS